MLLDKVPDRNIRLVYLSIFLLGIAYGVSIALTALFLDARGFSKQDIGSLAAWFASGIVIFSIPMGAMIRRLSAKYTLVASLVGYAFAVAIFPLIPSYGGIASLRFLDGAFSAGIWVSCETILLARSDASNKAFVTSLYGIAMAIGYVLGPVLAKGIVAVASMREAFFAAGVIATSSALLVGTKVERDRPVAEPEAPPPSGAEPYRRAAHGAPRTEVSWAQLLWNIKTACFATFAYGYFQASVVLFLPLFLIESKHISRERTIIIPAFFALGMLLFTNVCARIGDKRGHLLVMRTLASVGTLMVLGFVFLDAYVAMCVAVFVAGATFASLSPLSLALQGAIADPRDYPRSNAMFNVFYASGMLLGPPVSSRIFGRLGGEAMLYHLAALWTAFVVFSLVFLRDDPATRKRPAALTA